MPTPCLADLPPAAPGRRGWPWTEETPPVPARTPGGGTWPRVSIVTPSYNQASYLEETIRSVLLQGYPNLEYIIMDGGSGDGSVEIIRKYEPWLAVWKSEPDRGQGDAINKGWAIATGECLAWLNSDDFYYPGHLVTMVSAFLQRPAQVGLLYGDVETGWNQTLERKSGRRGRATSFEEIIRTLQIPIPQQSCLWRRSALEKIGPLDLRWRVTLDREFLLRSCLHTQFEYIPGVAALFRYHSGTFATSQQSGWLIEIPRLYREVYARADFPAELRRHFRETMCSAWLYCARIAQRIGRPWLATGYVMRAVATDPRVLFRKNDIYPAVWRRLRRLAPAADSGEDTLR